MALSKVPTLSSSCHRQTGARPRGKKYKYSGKPLSSAAPLEKSIDAGIHEGSPVTSVLLSQSQGVPLSYPAVDPLVQCLQESRCYSLRRSPSILARFCAAGSRAAASSPGLGRTKASRGWRTMSSPFSPPPSSPTLPPFLQQVENHPEAPLTTGAFMSLFPDGGGGVASLDFQKP